MIRKQIQKIWHKTMAGLVVPTGTISDLTQATSQTYLKIKDKAKAIEQLYAENGIALPSTCDLAGLINDAKKLSDAWLSEPLQGVPTTLLFRVGHLDRIADAILPLKNVSERSKYLSVLTSGSLDLLQRQKSNAKDILWELELWSTLKRRSFTVNLLEPPDIVVDFEDAKIGIACKKLYSEKHVQNVLSQAVSQIEPTFDFGIVAVNIDDLVPPDQILRQPNQQMVQQFMNDLNDRFLTVHERHFRKYLSSGRLLSAIISTSLLADMYESKPRFNNANQTTVWAISGLSAEKETQLNRFYNQYMN